MVTFFDSLEAARAHAQTYRLREKVLCFVVQGGKLLVFDHVPDDGAGVQVVAGGVKAGEPPEAAAVRELWEESGLSLSGPQYICSYLWEAPLPYRFTRQACHAYAFAAPEGVCDTWQHRADGHLFSFRWADLTAPGLDWEMDAALPLLTRQRSQGE
ncbi:MAG: NUDIX domain-containing protein [Deinococcus sp.]|nr:NUDIX domain-containing protein [Deinococcus sp.]